MCFRTEILGAQEKTVSVCQKMSQQGKRPVWVGNEVLKEPGNGKRMYRLWKEGQVSQKVFKRAIRAFGIKSGRPKLSLNFKW